MFNATGILIDAFIEDLAQRYRQLFPSADAAYGEAAVAVARMALSRVARSDALFHGVEHTMNVAHVGQDIMAGLLVRDGRLTTVEWLHFTAASVCFALGFLRDVCEGDGRRRCRIDGNGGSIDLPIGVTDGFLWPHAANRAMLFVEKFFRDHLLIDGAKVASLVDYTRFPPPADRQHDTATLSGLVRAAHYIGAIADPNFLLKLKPLFLELKECGLAQKLGYGSVVELRLGYPKLYWSTMYPLTRDGAELLTFTPTGRQWLANMYAQLLLEEHAGKADSGMASPG
ncbi:MAG: metal-dependent phosphohydrolase [Alphaproteobacteria bacterium]|nr:metal-dependent phosphohydrolase [Alphaproteobacteria bacterium]